jgi:conserved bacteriophage protein
MFEAELCCQPFTYLETGLKQLTLSASGTIINPGLLASDPVITVFGTGELELKINDTALIVSAHSGQLTIDSPRLVTHVAGKTQTDGISGPFPQLCPGANHIELGTGISRIEAQGNWRTL